MKILLKNRRELYDAGRWDIDFHLSPEGISKFPASLLKRVEEVADIAKDKRDPTKEAEGVFQYIDISSVDVATGQITNQQDVECAEAPSRARKVVRAFDVIVSTCRPTRGAIAVVPVRFHNQIASTAFSVVRPHENLNPFYLHFALRLPSTLEQFRKWSTGSSYPAILDSDVKKTVIPVPDIETQNAIAAELVLALRERANVIHGANEALTKTLSKISANLCGRETDAKYDLTYDNNGIQIHSLQDVLSTLSGLPPLVTDKLNGDDTPQNGV